MRSRARFCGVLGSVVAIGLTLAPGALAQSPTSGPHASAVTGTVVRVGTTSAPRAGLATASAAPTRGVRRTPRGPATAAPLVAARPQATGSGLATTTPTLLANFNGVSSRDSAVTNFGQEFEPPDQGLCVGNGFVVEMVNSAYTVYRPNGRVVTGPFNVNGPFDEGLTEFTSDPRCQYDAATHTWFASDPLHQHRQHAVAHRSGRQHLGRSHHAVDRLPDRHHRHRRQDRAQASRLPVLRRPAHAGHRRRSTSTSPPTSSRSRARSSTAPRSTRSPRRTSSRPARRRRRRTSSTSTSSASAARCRHRSSPRSPPATAPAEYFLNSLDPNGTFDQRIGVWAMTNRGRRGEGWQAHAVERRAALRGLRRSRRAPSRRASTSLLDAGDDRMQQTQYINGDVWGELDTAVTIPNDPRRARAQPGSTCTRPSATAC